jgi:flavin reductase (DIM6/NTAB) family NADH-FMN oxidoreductase RutF
MTFAEIAGVFSAGPPKKGHVSMMRHCQRAIQRIVFGDTFVPQAFTVGMADPQTEITVWLHGMGAPLDVTSRHSMACADPFTVCIAFDEGLGPREKEHRRLTLKFRERGGQKRVLGEIGLNLKSAAGIPARGTELILFEARSARNHCLPKAHILAHYARHRYLLWRRLDIAGIVMSFLERRAVMVMFIRPHPVVLLSLCDEAGGNIFPMNIMGDLGNGYFAFALKDSKVAAHLVERARRVALSSIPLSQTSLAYQLGANHRKQSIEWNELPFATRKSAKLHIPVPTFAQRVREMEVETVRKIGSHIFFVARIVSDEHLATGAGLCIVHGFYQAWRLKGRRADLEDSLAEDMHNKRGVPIDSLPL